MELTVTQPTLPPRAGKKSLDRFDRVRNAKGNTPVAELRGNMQRTMQTHAAVFRTTDLLREGLEKMKSVQAGYGDIRIADRSLIWNSDLVEALELDNLIGNAVTTIAGADARKELMDIFEVPVHLFLFVKVREKWGDDPERYREMGLEYPHEK